VARRLLLGEVMNTRHSWSLLPALLLAACSAAPDDSGSPSSTKSESAATETKTPAKKTSSTCKTGTDPEALSVCHGSKGTAGRCVPVSYLGDNKDTFESGDCGESTACVPDALVKSGGAVDLKTCQAFGKEGRCFWPLAKDIAQNYDVLKSQTGTQCDPDMVCAPCINPLDQQSTGVCEIHASSACP